MTSQPQVMSLGIKNDQSTQVMSLGIKNDKSTSVYYHSNILVMKY